MPVQQKVLGVLTGVSYISGLDYFRTINERVSSLIPREHSLRMAKNSRMVLACVDCDVYVDYLQRGDHEGCIEYLMEDGVRRLAAARVDVLIIASNTAHIVVDAVKLEFPWLPVLHIADTTARAVHGKQMRTVGLIGTEPTMADGSWLRRRLASHGLRVITPSSLDDCKRCYEIICQELSFGVMNASSRDFVVAVARGLLADGAEGVVLGCTELELLITPESCTEGSIPFFRSAELHMEAAARVQVGLMSVADFEPSAG